MSTAFPIVEAALKIPLKALKNKSPLKTFIIGKRSLKNLIKN
jgi:hypothetical protein